MSAARGHARFAPLLAGLSLLGLASGPLGAAATLDYNRDIRPILSENCFSCHGPDEHGRKGKRRLDLAEAATADREGIVAIAPGKPDASEAWLRIISPHDDEAMPPPESHLKLTADQKQKIKTWIEQGAPYAPHWAFVPPQQAPLPPLESRKSKIVNPVDAFVRARLAEEKLTPAPAADPATLIRRLSFDLTGLPPSPADVSAFEAASIKNPKSAVENLTDRLLASPHFGERMALDWLDAARYADTNGFSIDGGRHLWLWRDWVIQSFNDNLPYDRFLVEQLAGDLIPGRTEAQLIATGFQRNNMVTHEGGTIVEENLTNYNADRVKTLGEAVLGLTLACAQCHDHKFDPISQKDYFRLFAYFNSLPDKGLDGNGGVNPAPSVRARTVLKTGEEATLRAGIAALEAKLARPDAAVLAAWEAREEAQLAARGRGLRVHSVTAKKISTPNRAVIQVDGPDRVRIVEGGEMGAFDILTELPALDEPVTGLRFRMLPLPGDPLGSWGLGGPSVNPYAPGDLWREVSHYGSTPATSQTFVQDHGEKLYRRSLYTYWKRTAPPPAMTAFGAPNREVCTVARADTTTPLQALVTLNDPQFVEAARVFAERIVAQTGDERARLAWAFRAATTRTPRDRETAILHAALTRERVRYAANPAAAEAFLRTGEAPRNPALPPAEHAAWAQVAATLLNLSETLTRN